MGLLGLMGLGFKRVEGSGIYGLGALGPFQKARPPEKKRFALHCKFLLSAGKLVKSVPSGNCFTTISAFRGVPCDFK